MATAINKRKEITPQDFSIENKNQVRLTLGAKRKLLSKYQSYKQDIQLHTKIIYIVKAYHTSLNKKEFSQFENSLQRVLSYLL